MKARPEPPAGEPAPTLDDAFNTYVEVEAHNLRPDTWQQRERAFKSFMGFVGKAKWVAEVTRPMAARWAADLQRTGLTKRYVANQVSHVAQLFEAQIWAGHLPDGQNPVKGVVTLKASDKKMIRASGRGWEPFELDQLKRIFDPENFKRATQQHTMGCTHRTVFRRTCRGSCPNPFAGLRRAGRDQVRLSEG